MVCACWEPGCKATMKLLLRRTLVHYQFYAAIIKHLLMLGLGFHDLTINDKGA